MIDISTFGRALGGSDEVFFVPGAFGSEEYGINPKLFGLADTNCSIRCGGCDPYGSFARPENRSPVTPTVTGECVVILAKPSLQIRTTQMSQVFNRLYLAGITAWRSD